MKTKKAVKKTDLDWKESLSNLLTELTGLVQDLRKTLKEERDRRNHRT